MFLSHDGLEVIEVDSTLSKGELNSCREKFALSRQHSVLDRLLADFEDGKIPRGDWRKGEIEITGLKSIVINRFWHEPEWNVLFPPKEQGAKPTPGTYRWQEWNVGVDSGAAAFGLTTDRKVVLINSYRHAMRGWRIEIPRGVRKPSESLEDCGFRESLEEAGVKATNATEAIDLGRINPDTGLSRQEPQLIAYTNVEVDASKIRHDASEAIAGHFVLPLEELKARICSNEIRDAYTLAALLKAQLLGVL